MISRAKRKAAMSTPKRLRKYLEQGDGCCNCHDYSIEGGPFEQDGMFVNPGSLVHSVWRRMDKRLQARKYQELQD